jgi:proteasome lid subunit RPN8/RPN11
MSQLLRIEKRFADEIIAHAREAYPNECCGFLAGTDGTVKHVYRIANIDKNPGTRYLMDPQGQLNAWRDWERNGWEPIAIYHSHPKGALRLSETDLRMALESGWLDVYYVLVLMHDRNSPKLKNFRIIAEAEFEVF